MSNSDFQDRLERIQASKRDAPSGQTVGRSGATAPRKARPTTKLAGAFTLTLASKVLRYSNKNYETLKESYGLAAMTGLAVTGMALLVLGCWFIWKSVSGNGTRPVGTAHLPAKTSARHITVSTLLGLGLGVVASLLMFLSSAYRFTQTGASPGLSALCAFAALGLAAVSAMIGATAFVVRGRGLLRVPACFVIGAVFTLAVVRVMRINTHAWLDYLQ